MSLQTFTQHDGPIEEEVKMGTGEWEEPASPRTIKRNQGPSNLALPR